MGIYIFNTRLLKRYLRKDEKNPKSSSDFGKDVLPLMLKEGRRIFAYPFKGYWKDVGTVESLWEANMDLLSDEPMLDLYDRDFRIYTVNPDQPPHYLASTARVSHSLINEGCMVSGEVERSILFPGVYVGEGSVIKDSVIMSNVKIGADVRIEKAIVGEGVKVGNGSQIRAPGEKSSEIILIKQMTDIPDNSMLSSSVTSSIKQKGGAASFAF